MGTAIKLFTFVFVFYFILSWQWIGILVLISAYGVDLLIAKIQIDSLGSLVKLFIIFQGLSIWYLSSTSFMKLHIFDSSASFLTFNRYFDSHLERPLHSGVHRGTTRELNEVLTLPARTGPAHKAPDTNLHGARHGHDTEGDASSPGSAEGDSSHLRHQKIDVSGDLKPQRFNIEDLPVAPPIDKSWILKDTSEFESGEILKDGRRLHQELCNAALVLDLAAIKYLLHDIGVPSDTISDMDANRNAFHW